MASFGRKTEDHWVYEFWYGSECLYVGLCEHLTERLRAWHKAEWWDRVTHVEANIHFGREAGLDAEAELIRRLQPTYNVNHTERASANRSTRASR
jgi:hypothetical protein